MPVGDVCRQVGISEQTFYRWKKVYGGMLPSEARELKQLRDENTQAETAGRRPVARQGHAAGCRSKKVLKPVKQREVMRYLMGRYAVSARRACRVVRTTRSSVYYKSRKDPLTALRQRMRELAQTRVRFGYRRLRVLMHREGWHGRQRALLSRVHRGRPGVAAQTAVASRDGRAPRAAATGDRAQRHLEHGLRGGPAGRWAALPGVDRDRPVHARVPGDRRRPRR